MTSILLSCKSFRDFPDDAQQILINNQVLVLKDIEDNLDLRVVLQKSSDGFKGSIQPPAGWENEILLC